MRKVLTIREVAAITGFSVYKIRRLIRAGRLPAKNSSAGSAKPRYVVPESELERFLKPDTGLVSA